MELTHDQKLHLDCGAVRPKSWINVDDSWNARHSNYPFMRRNARVLRIMPQKQYEIDWNGKIKILDVRNPLPFSEGTISVAYASHLLEHLYHSEAISLLKKCIAFSHREVSSESSFRI